MTVRFGPAGQCRYAKELKIKSTMEYLDYLHSLGLSAFEYQCGRGVNIGEEKAQILGAHAAKLGIELSVHAPYYISLASREEEKRLKSIDYILQSAAAVSAMGGRRVVVHPGGLNGRTRKEAAELAASTLAEARCALDAAGFRKVILCPETMGKVSQLGDLDEVLFFCRQDVRALPCIDFGHMNARTHGGLSEKSAFAALLDRMEEELGERARSFHVHFSKIEYSAGGEVRHLTFEDTRFGPNFEPLMELISERSLQPVIICESAGTQSEDACAMMTCYKSMDPGFIA